MLEFKKEDWKVIGFSYSISILILLICYAVFRLYLKDVVLFQVSYHGEPGVVNIFTSNDSEWYLKIARHGYTDSFLTAFFPLYPVIIGTLFKLTGINPAVIGVVLNLVMYFWSGVLFYKLLPENCRRYGIVIFFINPVSIYLYSVYTEALFIFLTLLTWSMIQSKRWALSGIFLGLSLLTRNAGYILAFVIFIKLVSEGVRGKDRAAIGKLLKVCTPAAVIGIIYPVFLFIRYHNPLMFVSVQYTNWGKTKTFFLYTIMRDIVYLKAFGFSIYGYAILIDLVTIALVIFLIVQYWKKEFYFSLFMAIYLLLVLSTCNKDIAMPATLSLFRYMWGSFPFLYLLAVLIKRKKSKLVEMIGLYCCIILFISNTIAVFLKALIA